MSISPSSEVIKNEEIMNPTVLKHFSSEENSPSSFFNNKRKLNSGANPGYNNGGGRKLSTEWEHVYKLTESDYRCKHCNKPISAKIARIKNHLKKCTHFCYQSHPYNTSQRSFHLPPTTTTKTSTVSPLPSAAVHFDEETNYDIIGEKIAKFFYSANLNFQQVDNPAFTEMIRALKPDYNLPSRFELANKLLHNVQDKIENELGDEYEEQNRSNNLYQDDNRSGIPDFFQLDHRNMEYVNETNINGNQQQQNDFLKNGLDLQASKTNCFIKTEIPETEMLEQQY